MFDLQGHRGARGLFPENTIEGFRAAMELGVTSFELDVAVTRDGVAVVHHDPALNPDLARGPDGAWISGPGPLLRDLTWDEVQRYDVGRIRPGSRTATLFPHQVPRDGARIPRLADVLALKPVSGPDPRFFVELKLLPDHRDWTVPVEAMADLAVACAEEADALARCTFQSFDWRAQHYLRRTRPDLQLAWLTQERTVADAPLWWDRPVPSALADVPGLIAEAGGGTWTAEWQTLRPDLIEAAHRAGLHVVPWTVNDTDAMRRLIAWGVDGLITDYPDRGLAVLAEREAPSS